MPDSVAPLLGRQTVIGMFIETTSGTNVLSSVTAALGNTTYQDSVTCEPVDIIADTTRTPSGAFGGTFKSPPGRQMGRLNFTQEMRHGDSLFVGTNEAIARGLGFTGTPGSSPFTPVQSMASKSTYSIKVWEGGTAAINGRVKQMFGAVANATFNLTVGQIATIDWEWFGIYDALGTDTTAPALSDPATLPYVCQGMTVTVAGGGSIPHVSTIRFSLNNVVEARDDVTAVDVAGTRGTGIRQYMVTDRTITGEFDFESRIKNPAGTGDYEDPLALYRAGTEVAVVATLTNGTNTFTFTAAKCQHAQLRDQRRGRIRADAATFNCNASSGNDELSLSFT